MNTKYKQPYFCILNSVFTLLWFGYEIAKKGVYLFYYLLWLPKIRKFQHCWKFISEVNDPVEYISYFIYVIVSHITLDFAHIETWSIFLFIDYHYIIKSIKIFR